MMTILVYICSAWPCGLGNMLLQNSVEYNWNDLPTNVLKIFLKNRKVLETLGGNFIILVKPPIVVNTILYIN